jgi:EAL domain-containing protein (putative c-di-GMP-specific phosphodiesterase class I)
VLKQGTDFTDRHEKRFLSIVSDADLSCPLKQKIFEKACAALKNKSNMAAAIKTHASGLLTKTKFVTSTRIFKTESGKDLLKA